MSLHHDRLRRIDAGVEMRALADMVGKQPELAGGTSTFAVEPALRKPGFLRSDEGDGLAALVDLLGDCLEENGALLACRCRKCCKSSFGSAAGAVDQFRCADSKVVCLPMRRLGLKCRRSGNPFAGDEMLA